MSENKQDRMAELLEEMKTIDVQILAGMDKRESFGNKANGEMKRGEKNADEARRTGKLKNGATFCASVSRQVQHEKKGQGFASHGSHAQDVRQFASASQANYRGNGETWLIIK